MPIVRHLQKQIFSIVVVIFAQIILGLPAYGVVRLVPRWDYGQPDHIHHAQDLFSITNIGRDFINGLHDLSRGQQPGGDYDLVYQKEPGTEQTHIYSCPSLRPCLILGPRKSEFGHNDGLALLLHATYDKKNKSIRLEEDAAMHEWVNVCANNPDKWRCRELFVADEKRVCEHFVPAFRHLIWKNFIYSNIVGGLITAQIHALNEGIGETLDHVSGVANTSMTIFHVNQTDCDSGSMDLAHRLYDSLNKKAIFVVQEKGKENVSYAIGAFSRHTLKDPKNPESDDDKLQTGGFYRDTYLNPFSIDDGGYIADLNSGPVQFISRDWTEPRR